ncbi:MAG: DNA-binding domain-containing protein [Kofleriaceae bacterium]
MADLAALQRQFYDHVVAGGPDDALVASGDLAIYASMYAIRLHDALADDYPKLRAALGDDAFQTLVRAYLRAHPPSSFTLRDTGLALPGWLAASELAPPWAGELAALERARMEVFDARDARPLAQAEAIALGEALPELVMTWVPASIVVSLGWAVDDLWSALEDGEPGFEPARDPRVVLVWRRELAVLHRTLDPDEAPLAASIATGARFAEICEQLGVLHGEAAGARAAELLLRWIAAGALAA